MLQKVIKGEPHSMALIPLCINIAWELAYTAVYPSANRVERSVFIMAVIPNLFIMVGAVRSARTEWRQHSPILAEHAGLVILVGVIVCFTGHVAMAMQLGPGLAISWGAVVSQVALSIGGVFQLLERNSTAGTSWMLWYVLLIRLSNGRLHPKRDQALLSSSTPLNFFSSASCLRKKHD